MKVISNKENIYNPKNTILETLKISRLIQFEKTLKTGGLAVFRDGCTGAYRTDLDSEALRKFAKELIELADDIDEQN